MATIIDSLVVQLGIDGSQFEQGQRDALESFKKTRDQTKAFADAVEEQGKRLNDMFGAVKRGAVGILGAFAGEETVSFLDRLARMDAQTYRFASTIGVSTREMSMWQSMIKQVGGTAEEAQQGFGRLSSQMALWAIGAQQLPPMTAFLFGQAGIRPGAGPGDVMRSMTAYMERQRAMGASAAIQRAELLGAGFTEHQIYLIMEGTKALNEKAEAARKAGLEDEKAGEAAADYQRKASLLDQALQNLARVTYPSLAAAVNSAAGVLQSRFGGWIASILAGVGVGAVAGSVIPGVGTGLGALAGGIAGAATYATSGGGGGTSPAAGGSGGAGTNWANFLSGLSYLETSQTGAASGSSSAQGYFQFLSGTAAKARGVGIGDPRFGSYGQQAAMTMAYIRHFYPAAAAAIDAGDFQTAIGMLTGEWPSLPGGAQPQSLARYGTFFRELQGGGPRPPGAAAAASHVTNRAGDRTSSISIGNISVASAKASPREVAMEIPDAIRRMSTAAPMDSGLA